MLQRKVPQTLVYGVKQALTRSQQQSKNAADGSDLMAVKEHVQSSSSSSASSATTVKKFVGEVSGGVQLSNNFTIDAVANVSDAIVKAIGIDKLMEIASTNIELPDEQFIAHYGSLDFSQEEFDMFTSGSHHYSAAIANNNSTNNSHHSMALINTSAAVNNKSSTTATNNNNRTNMTSKMSSGPVVSSANSSVKFEDVTHRRENALNALTERILSGLKQLVTQLRQLLWNGSSVFSTAASSNSQELSASAAAASNTTNQTRVKELTALGVIFAAAYAVDVILFRMFKNQMVSHSFRSNLMGTLRTMNF